MRCHPSNVASLLVAGAIVMAFMNVFIFVACLWINSYHQPGHNTPGPTAKDYLNEGVLEAAQYLPPTRDCPELVLGQQKEEKFRTIIFRELYAYSAYLDHAKIRIIALRRRIGVRTPLKCHVWYKFRQRDHLVATDATVEHLPEDHERRYTAAFVFCHLQSETKNLVPHAVSVTASDVPCPDLGNTLRVLPLGQVTSQFTVCVTPLNFRYSRAYELVEMVELNRLLGADRVVFYNHSTGPNVDKVLEMYKRQGMVEVHPWHLPIQTDTWPPTTTPEIHYFGQMASLNDCLYRYRNRSQYLVYQDLDEFIIPTHFDNWAELVQDREKQNGVVSAFMFRNVFFRKEWLSPAKDFQTFAEKFNSVVLKYTRRESRFQLVGVRSKLIVNPRLVASLGVHHVLETKGLVDFVSEDVANLHHYRNWENPNDRQPQVEDLLLVDKYGSRLVKRLEKAWSQLGNVPLDINITIYGSFV